MATIKDIAIEAGVAQGTVSNVLNGKGNVSSDKILQVEQAAAKLGYTINRRAKMLRKGSSNLLGILLPNIYNKQYVDFYLSFKHYAESQNYAVALYLSEDNLQNEMIQLELIRSEMSTGLACFTCQPKNGKDIYAAAGFAPNEVVFVEREHAAKNSYIGFDYYAAGFELGEKACKKHYRNMVLVTENIQFSSQSQFCDGFFTAINSGDCNVKHIQTDMQHCNNHFLQILGDAQSLDVVFIANFGIAQCFKNVCNTFYRNVSCDVYTLSPLFTMPTNDFYKYELNYRLMGRSAAQQLIHQIEEKSSVLPKTVLQNNGLRSWKSNLNTSNSKKRITVLTLDSPTARIMENLARLYSDTTNVEVKIAISSYDGIHETLSGMGDLSTFDIIRLDHTWLSWFADKIFIPPETLDPNIYQLLNTFIPGLTPKYSSVNGIMYALPETPSAQMLFYRKDLFENTALQRLYKEQYKCELTPPTDHKSFNRIARFFTKKFNPYSPVEYGTTLTLGNSGVAATEYLTRFFSHSQNIFSQEGKLLLQSDTAIQAMNELIEAKQYAPNRYSSWWRETAREFSRGNTAMTILFSNYASEMLGTDSQIIDNIAFSTVPGGNPLLGGGSIGVCKNSKNKNEALDFIKWVCSEEITTAMTLLGSVSPCEKTYENYEVMDTYPWLELSKESILLSKTNRIPKDYSKHFDERRFLSIIGMAVNNVYNETMTAEEALEFAVTTYHKHFD